MKLYSAQTMCWWVLLSSHGVVTFVRVCTRAPLGERINKKNSSKSNTNQLKQFQKSNVVCSPPSTKRSRIPEKHMLPPSPLPPPPLPSSQQAQPKVWLSQRLSDSQTNHPSHHKEFTKKKRNLQFCGCLHQTSLVSQRDTWVLQKGLCITKTVFSSSQTTRSSLTVLHQGDSLNSIIADFFQDLSQKPDVFR